MGSLKTLIINNTDVVTCNAIKGTYCTKKKESLFTIEHSGIN